jgi:electron transfer flavoprotein beta subunit
MTSQNELQILVGIKQVPDVSEIKLDPVTHTLIREGVPSIVNPWDDLGIEAALRLKERYGGFITVLTMGPPQAIECLRKCIALGCDEAFLLSDRVLAGADTIATAYTLSCLIKKIPYDIIICGRQAMDAETGHTGPQLAELLDIPQICYAKEIEVDLRKRKITVHKEADIGTEIIESSLPVLLTTSKSMEEQRLPTLKGVIRSRRKGVKLFKASDLEGDQERYGLKGSPTFVSKVNPPPPRTPEALLDGDPKESVEKLVGIIKEKKEASTICLGQ